VNIADFAGGGAKRRKGELTDILFLTHAEARRRGEDLMREIDEITGEIVDAAYKIHVGLGPGLLESVYEVVLARQLENQFRWSDFEEFGPSHRQQLFPFPLRVSASPREPIRPI
jgi:hypothetical protein